MFTGIIDATPCVIDTIEIDKGCRLILKAPYNDFVIGESISVNGACLTLVSVEGGHMAFDVSPETISKTMLGNLVSNMLVNTERAMLASQRFGGHYVTGHIDTVLTLASIHQVGEYLDCRFTGFSADERAYLVPKGSITLAGVSLTLNDVSEHEFSVMLIPHTTANTTFQYLKEGDRINAEFDYLTRIVKHQLAVVGR